MKIAELKTFVVGNPPPAFGGRYFLFLKLKTACGIEGVGEVYAASFAPKAIVTMIEDVFERHVEGADPFRIEALWRNVYGRGYSGRPDISLMGVLSGIEMALWDIVGKAVGKPVYALLGGKVHERLRSYTYLYPDEPGSHAYSDSPVYSNPTPRRARAQIYGAGLHRGEVRSGRALFDLRSAPAEPRAARAVRSVLQDFARGGRDEMRSAVRHARPVHRLRARCAWRGGSSLTSRYGSRSRRRPRRPEEMARVAAQCRMPIATGERLTTKYEFARVLETGAASILQMNLGRVGGILEAKKIAGMAEAHYAQIAPHLYCGPVVGAANIQLAACSPNFLILESIERWDGFHARDSQEADPLGGRLRHPAGRAGPRRRAQRGGRPRPSVDGQRPASRAAIRAGLAAGVRVSDHASPLQPRPEELSWLNARPIMFQAHPRG